MLLEKATERELKEFIRAFNRLEHKINKEFFYNVRSYIVPAHTRARPKKRYDNVILFPKKERKNA